MTLPLAAAVPQDGLPLPQRHWAMLTILLGIALTVVDSTMMSLALPDIARDLHTSPTAVIGVVNAYQVAILALVLPLAALADRFGHRRIYFAGVAVFGVASVACWTAPTLAALVVARALQGVGAAGVFAMNTALVRATYPRERLGRGIAVNSMTVAAAAVAGPPLAALLLSMGSWHLLFAINVPATILILVIGMRHLPAPPVHPTLGARLSWLDVGLNAGLFASLFLGVSMLLPHRGEATQGQQALVLLGIAALVGTVYVRRQRREPVPLLPLDLLRIPVFRLSMATSIGSFAAHTLSTIALPFLLLEERHFAYAETGAMLTTWPIATIAAAALAGRLIGRLPDGLLAGTGLLVMGAGFALLAGLPAEAPGADIVWRLALCGAGFGLFQSPNNHTIVTSTPPHRSAATGGMLSSARLLGQTLGALTLAVLFGWPGLPPASAPVWALGLSALFATAAAVCSLLRLNTAPTAH